MLGYPMDIQHVLIQGAIQHRGLNPTAEYAAPDHGLECVGWPGLLERSAKKLLCARDSEPVDLPSLENFSGYANRMLLLLVKQGSSNLNESS